MVFVKGQSGNPSGRRPGSKSLSSALYKMLGDPVIDKNGQFVVDKNKKFITYRQLIAKQIMGKAASGDINAIKHVFSYIDGAPQEYLDLTTNGDNINTYGDDILEQMANEMEARLKLIKT